MTLQRKPVGRELGYRGAQVEQMIGVWIETKGRSPTSHEIMKALGFCDRAGVIRVIQRLEKRGRVRRVRKGRIRQIRLVINNN